MFLPSVLAWALLARTHAAPLACAFILASMAVGSRAELVRAGPSVLVEVHWAKEAPLVALSVRSTLTNRFTGQEAGSRVLTPADASFESGELVPLGSYVLSVSVHPSPDGSGEPIARGDLAVTAPRAGVATMGIAPAGTPSRVVVSAPLPTLGRGETTRLVASALDSDGNLVPLAGDWQWKSSDPSVATVDAMGTVTGAGPGTARLTAAHGGQSAGADLRVVPWHTTRKVLMISHDPVLVSRGGARLHEEFRWNDPDTLAREYLSDIREVSGGQVDYVIAERILVDGFPLKRDGFRYDEATYLSAWAGRTFHDPDGVDYKAVLEEFGAASKVDAGTIDEVWLFGAPYFGYWESLMVGPTAYWCNSPPLTEVTTKRPFVVMGFNYERGVGEMLEDLGHRSESILTHVFGSWEAKETHAWNRFTLHEKALPGKAACGNVHYAPNSEADYDWGNKREVDSTCDDWLSYPNLTGKTRRVTCEEWGGGDIRKHHKWWFSHFPKADGATDGFLNDWWKYVVAFDTFPSPP